MMRSWRLRSWLETILLLSVLVFLPASPAHGAMLYTQLGNVVECTSSCTTGASADAVAPGGAVSFRVQSAGTGTIAADVQQCVEANPAVCNTNSSWINVGSLSGINVATTIANPMGFYRVNVTTCTACTYRYFYRFVYLVVR